MVCEICDMMMFEICDMMMFEICDMMCGVQVDAIPVSWAGKEGHAKSITRLCDSKKEEDI